MKSIVTKPTCFKNFTNPSFIDLVVSNVPKRLRNVTCIENNLSDCHSMIFFATKMQEERRKKRLSKYRRYEYFDYDKYMYYFMSYDCFCPNRIGIELSHIIIFDNKYRIYSVYSISNINLMDILYSISNVNLVDILYSIFNINLMDILYSISNVNLVDILYSISNVNLVDILYSIFNINLMDILYSISNVNLVDILY